MVKILIIEDEPLVAKDIEKLLRRVEADCEIVATLSSVKETKVWIGQKTPVDLIISDIQLSDGTSFEIFESMDVGSPIIFTTAYDDYAIRAFKLNSIDYLLKPIDGDELAAAMRKYKSLRGSPIIDDHVKAMIQQWGKANKYYKERFLALHGNSLVPVMQSEIGYFHKDQLIYLHTLNNEKFICEFHALDDVEELLDPTQFFRVNRQFIIHIQAVGRIKSTHKGLTVVLKNPLSIEIDISREKASAFKKWAG
jgi:two-component system, LytTR family, response regulator